MDRFDSMIISSVAGEYLEAAQMLHPVNKTPCSTPLYFLLCQSIELSLKAYLRGCGTTKGQLIKIGHDLVKALDYAQAKKLSDFFSLSPLQTKALRLINLYYKAKDLQYTEMGIKHYPDFGILLELANDLYSQTREFCVSKRECHAGKTTEVN